MEQTEERVNRLLDAIENSVSKTGEFVVEQAPLVAQEYLAWYFWQSTICAIGFFAMGIVLLVTALPYFREFKKDILEQDIAKGMFAVVGSIVAIVLIGSGVTNVFSVVKVCVAPRIVLLEKVSELMS